VRSNCYRQGLTPTQRCPFHKLQGLLHGLEPGNSANSGHTERSYGGGQEACSLQVPILDDAGQEPGHEGIASAGDINSRVTVTMFSSGRQRLSS
jgi:hypothetical protein